MTDEEFRAIIAAGPAVVMVESRHMIALLDERDGLRGALSGFIDIIDKAGLSNLAMGVQLGPVSWYVKASDQMDAARAALGVKP